MQRAAALDHWANRVESDELVEADTATLRAVTDSAQPRSETLRYRDQH